MPPPGWPFGPGGRRAEANVYEGWRESGSYTSVGAPLVWMLRTQLVVAVAPGTAQRLTSAALRPENFAEAG
jgi:hypothetical protein